MIKIGDDITMRNVVEILSDLKKNVNKYRSSDKLSINEEVDIYTKVTSIFEELKTNANNYKYLKEDLVKKIINESEDQNEISAYKNLLKEKKYYDHKINVIEVLSEYFELEDLSVNNKKIIDSLFESKNEKSKKINNLKNIKDKLKFKKEFKGRKLIKRVFKNEKVKQGLVIGAGVLTGLLLLKATTSIVNKTEKKENNKKIEIESTNDYSLNNIDYDNRLVYKTK